MQIFMYNFPQSSVCSKYASGGSISSSSRIESFPVSSSPVDRKRWFYMADPDFMLCMIPKVASTSLSSMIIRSHQTFREGETHADRCLIGILMGYLINCVDLSGFNLTSLVAFTLSYSTIKSLNSDAGRGSKI